MSVSPSESLIALLAQLRLATAGQAQSVAPRVSRLARDLPGFDSVWVDALAQARVLTPYQAAQINAGRGASLAVGPYILASPLAGPSYAQSFTAAERDSRVPARLLVVDVPQGDVGAVAAALEQLVQRSRLAQHPAIKPIRQAGVDQRRVWASCQPDRGVLAARWMVENGRFPAAVVLGVARQLAAALAELEQIELVHGDLSPWGLTIDGEGQAGLIAPGLRPIVRRHEGYAFGDLQPEAFDCLAPERIESGAPVSMATDMYACGCLLWHLAAGRPPFAGGSAITKLKAVHRAKAPDIEQLTVDAPPRLVAAIRACMMFDPARRPPSFAALAEMLGPTTRGQTSAARQLLAQNLGPRRLWGPAPQRTSLVGKLAPALALATCLALLLAAPIGWRHRHQLAWWPRAELAGETNAQATAERHNAAGAEETSRGRPTAKTHVVVDGERLAGSPPAHIAASNTKTSRIATPDVRAAMRDDRVMATAYRAPRSVVEPRLLATDRPQRLAGLTLCAGQTVRGVGVGRPLIVVSHGGMRVRGEDVIFENVDFVLESDSYVGGYYDDEYETAEAGGIDWDAAAKLNWERDAAIVWLEAEQAEFRGCSFQDGRSQSERAKAKRLPSAIAWLNVAANGARAAPLPGALTLDHCVFWHVDAAVECRSARSLDIRIGRSLHACSGPLVRLAEAPRRNQTTMLNLANVTLRAAGAVLECPLPEQPLANHDGNAVDAVATAAEPGRGPSAANFGRIAIEAVDSVFAPRSPGALVLVDSPHEPQRFFEHVEWTGHGSLVTLATPIAAWRSGREEAPQELAEEDLRVAGLVRGEVEFEGGESTGLDAARLRRWQAPLRSSSPPGIGPGDLTLPRFAH